MRESVSLCPVDSENRTLPLSPEIFHEPFHLDKVLAYTLAAGEYGLPALASQVLRLGVCQYILQE